MKRMGQRIWKNPLIFVLIAAMLTGWTGCGDTVHSYDGVHFDTETDDHGMEEQDSQKEGASEQADLAEVDSSGMWSRIYVADRLMEFRKRMCGHHIFWNR